MLVSTQAWARVASHVTAEDFFRVAHGMIFRAMQALISRGAAIDFVTLRDQLQRDGVLDDAGGPAYLAQLADGVPRSTNIEHYAEIVQEKARLRRLLVIGEDLARRAGDGAMPAAQVADAAIRRLSSAIGVERSGMVDATKAVRDYYSALQAGTLGEPLPTGYLDLDELMGGFRPEDLVVVAARPSVGKTSFALGFARAMARKNVMVPFFTLEMGIPAIAERLLSWEAGVPVMTAVRGTATLEQYSSLSEAAFGYDVPQLKLQPLASTLTEIDAWCRRLQGDSPIGCVVIDYLQLLSPDARASSQEAEVAAISRGLKRLGRDLKVPVVALSQLSRAPEARQDKRPHLSDLRGSGALEQDADIVLILFRPELHARTPENDGIAEVIVAKHRNGPTGVVRLAFNKTLAQFTNLAPQGI